MNITNELSSEEILRLRQILKQDEVKKKEARKEKEEARHQEFLDEKEIALGSIKDILELYGNINYFKNTSCDFTQGRPVIWWKNGGNIRLGAPGYYPADPGQFKEMGLGGIHKFYDLSEEERNSALAGVARKLKSVVEPDQLFKWKKQVKSAKGREEFVPLKEIIKVKEKEVKKILRER